MRRVPDLLLPRKVIVQTNQEFYRIPPPPFAPSDMMPTPVAAPQKKRRPRKQPLAPVYSIDCREENDVGDEENVERIGRKRTRKFTPSDVIRKRKSKCDLRSNVLIKNASRNMLLVNSAVQSCLQPGIRTSSESVNRNEIPPLSNPSPLKAVQIELFPQNDHQTAGYRKITFGNHTVINSVIPTIIIDDDDEFDMFNTPNLKSLPDEIFEPAMIKQEDDIVKQEDDIVKQEEDIINEDVLIKEDKLFVSLLGNERNISTEADLDERVETLRNITSDLTKETIDKKDTTADSKIEDKVIPEVNAQKSLLDNLNLQIQLLEDIVYGSAQKNHSSSSIEAMLEENTSESVRSVETDGQTPNTSMKIVSDELDVIKTPNDLADGSISNQREMLNPVNPASGETEGGLSTMNEVKENQEILAKEEVSEILCNPFANTFGKPDEVIIALESIESDGKPEEVAVLVPLQTQLEDVKDDGKSVKKTNEVKGNIRERIRQIIREEAGRDEVTVCEEARRTELKKKIAALQRINSYLHDIIDHDTSGDPTREVSKVSFVEKLIDSTLNLYTLQKKRNKTQKRGRNWKSLQEFKKLLSIVYPLHSKGTRLKTLKQLIKIYKATQTPNKEQNKSKQNDESGNSAEIGIKLQKLADHHYTNTIEDQSLPDELTLSSDLGKDKDEIENTCLLFSEIEEIIGPNLIKTELTYDKNKVVEELSATPENPSFDDLDTCDIKVGESLKTYSRKLSINLTSTPKKVLVSLEKIEPDLKVKLDEPKKSTKAKKEPLVRVADSSENIPCVIEVDENQNKLSNVYIKREHIPKSTKKKIIEPEWPVRRVSSRVRKRPEFYGNVCQIEKKKPNRRTKTKVELQ